MEVNGQKLKVKEMTDILVSRFAFISGLKTKDGHPIMTFPDSRTYIDFEQYQLLIGYLLQVPPLEEDHSSKRSYVIIVDRRLDKWSSVRLLFTYLTVSYSFVNRRSMRFSVLIVTSEFCE